MLTLHPDYSVTIYGKMGIQGDETLKYQAISSVIALVAQALCMLLIDKFGRRWPLIIGNLGNMVTFIIAAIMLAVFPPGTSSNKSAAWGFIIITWIYNFSFSATCGPLSWIIPAEIFDTKTRAKGVSIATMISFAFNTMIGQVTKPAMESVGWKYYLLFIVSKSSKLSIIIRRSNKIHRSATSPTPFSSIASFPKPQSDRWRR